RRGHRGADDPVLLRAARQEAQPAGGAARGAADGLPPPGAHPGAGRPPRPDQAGRHGEARPGTGGSEAGADGPGDAHEAVGRLRPQWPRRVTPERGHAADRRAAERGAAVHATGRPRYIAFDWETWHELDVLRRELAPASAPPSLKFRCSIVICV